MNYQKIHINDVKIDGTDRMKDYKWMLSNKVKGKTILDIGCYTGFFSLQSLYEGAKYCLGIDLSPTPLRIANDIKNRLKFKDVDFLQKNFYNYKTDKKFDFVLCLNILHHIANEKNIETFLNKMDLLSNERMFFMISPPTKHQMNNNILYVEEKNHKGVLKSRISPKYIESFFNKYKVKYKNSMTVGNGDRYIVEVNKVKEEPVVDNTCLICGKVLKSARGVKTHMSRMHKDRMI